MGRKVLIPCSITSFLVIFKLKVAFLYFLQLELSLAEPSSSALQSESEFFNFFDCLFCQLIMKVPNYKILQMSKFLDLFKKKSQKPSTPKSQPQKPTLSIASTPKKQPQQLKMNFVNVFNHEEQVKISTTNNNLRYNNSDKRVNSFQEILSAPVVDYQMLKAQAWNGIPQRHRSLSWKILLKYCPTNQDNIQFSLNKKRKDYHSMVQTYIEKPTLEQDAQQKKIYKLINDDVLRTLPQTNLFRNETVQKMMRRILYVWHIRHPSSGYVQGINDIVTPFIVVYLSDYVQIRYDNLEVPDKLGEVNEEAFWNVQADSYWCLCKILDRILDNYTSSWPGIEKSFGRMKEIIKRVDPQLLQHFQKQGIDFYHMYFKWVTCLLLRQFSVKIGLRLFDTYIADESNYFNFIMYILAAIILKYSRKFKKMRFEEMMIFQQNMPTKEWSQEDICTVIAEAYVYQSYFTK